MAAGGKFIGGIRVGVSMDTKKLAAGASKARSAFKSVADSSEKMDRRLKRATKSLKRFAATAMKMGKVVVTAFVAMSAAVVVKLIRSLETLNRSMRRSLAIMGDVSTSMRVKMRDAAIETSRTVSASSSEMADSFYFLASAGLDAEQSLAALPKVAAFGAAGNFDMALATDLLTDAQSALGLSSKDAVKNVKEMARVSDVLVKANTLANASVQQFSEALTNKAGASMKAWGIEVEDGVAVLAAFADQGIKAADAGTAYDIVLRDLTTKAIKFSGKFKQAQIAVFDANDEIRHMPAIIADIEKSLAGMSDKTKKAFLLDLGFTDKSLNKILALIGTSGKMAQFAEGTRNAIGITKEVADKMLTPLEKSMANLSASFDKLATSMGPVLDAMSSMVDNVSEVVQGMEILTGTNEVGGAKHQSFNRPAIDSHRNIFKNPASSPERVAFRGTGESMVSGAATGVAYAQSLLNYQPLQEATGAHAVRRVQEAGESGMAVASQTVDYIGNIASDVMGSIFTPILDAVNPYVEKPETPAEKKERVDAKAASDATAIAKQEEQAKQKIGDVAFAQSGSAESFRQQARIRRQAEGNKMEKTRTKDIAKIREALTRAPLVVGEANFGGST